MYARAVDDAAARLRSLRCEEREDLGLAALVLASAVVAAEIRPPLAVPLFLGGLAVGVLGVRALWRRWDLVERLSGERDAYVIPEVLAYASREAAIDRRHSFAALIRSRLPQPGVVCDERVAAAADELEALAAELDDGTLVLDPAAAVACMRLLTEVGESPLLNPALPPEDLRSRIRQIRAGFKPVPYEDLVGDRAHGHADAAPRPLTTGERARV
jgi:hypothetical protein